MKTIRIDDTPSLFCPVNTYVNEIPRKRGRMTAKKKRYRKRHTMWFLFGFVITLVIIYAVRGLLWLAGFVIMLPFAIIKQIIRIMGGHQ